MISHSGRGAGFTSTTTKKKVSIKKDISSGQGKVHSYVFKFSIVWIEALNTRGHSILLADKQERYINIGRHSFLFLASHRLLRSIWLLLLAHLKDDYFARRPLLYIMRDCSKVIFTENNCLTHWGKYLFSDMFRSWSMEIITRNVAPFLFHAIAFQVHLQW